MELNKVTRRTTISLTLSADSRVILEKLAGVYGISQSRAVELIILQAGPKLLAKGKRSNKRKETT